ncbi:MAG: NUDIX domain-containing protein [Patescibacteria group bacterium]|nr:NUDIX domain-containing protein [Patescibacteria group bacterium]
MYKYCPQCKTKLVKKNLHTSDPVRLCCPRCGYVQYNNPAPTVTGLFKKDNKYLFSQRAIEPLKNYWDFPGGFIESFEPPKKALKREMKEELTVAITKADFFGVYIDKYFYNEKDQSTLNLYYLVKYQGHLKPKDDVKAIEWFTLDNLPEKIAFKHIYQVIKDLKKYESKTIKKNN